MAFKCGLRPTEYYEMSFEEIGLYIDTYFEKERDNQKQQLTHAFYHALINNAKKPVEAYKAILKELDKEHKPMTDDDLYKKAKELNTLFGGKFEKKEGD